MIDFLVIGSQKCATSWLYLCMQDHPELCLPKQKKEIEYIGGELYKEKGLSWYLSLFDHCKADKIKGDVSVEYIVNADSARILKENFPSVKLVLSIRNPTQRALSALKWYTRKGMINDPSESIVGHFDKAISNFDLSKYELLKFDYNDILYRGVYYNLINNYLKYFSNESILLVNYEDIKQKPLAVLRDIYAFLGVDPEFKPPSLAVKPKKNSNNKLLVRLERAFPKNKYISNLVDRLHQHMPAESALFDDEKVLVEKLNQFYLPYNKLLTSLIEEKKIKVAKG